MNKKRIEKHEEGVGIYRNRTTVVYLKYSLAAGYCVLGSLAALHIITLGRFLSLFISSVNETLCFAKRESMKNLQK